MTRKKQELELEGQEPEMLCMKKMDNESSPLLDEDRDEEMTKSALAEFRAKEEEIQARKSAIKDKVEARIGRVEQQANRLLQIRGELESLNDPMKKEVVLLCKRIQLTTRDVKVLGLNSQKKEKEYREAIEAFNEKNKKKGQLIAKLVELVTESEKLRSKKLEELCKNI
ncbi:hypothetical protein ACS0TY_020207 [Phlomoides rotata]